MRKVMLLAAMLAMVLAAAAPALAQQGDVNLGDDQINVGDDTQYQAVCQNVFDEINATGTQYAGSFNDSTVDASAGAAGAGDDVAAANAQQSADIAANLGISVAVVNACLNNFASASAASPTAATVTATSTATASAASASATALPSTGGPAAPSSVLALGAGALLVAGGLLARRIVR
jgi:LPXTG-motif cell wall-anchored protein